MIANVKSLFLDIAPAACEGIASPEVSHDKCTKEDVVADVVEDELHADSLCCRALFLQMLALTSSVHVLKTLWIH